MSYNLEECIKDSYQDTMKDFTESDTQKEANWEFNKLYYTLRNRLLPEEQQMLDAIFNAMEECNKAETLEAFYRGVVLGIAQHKKVLGELSLE